MASLGVHPSPSQASMQTRLHWAMPAHGVFEAPVSPACHTTFFRTAHHVGRGERDVSFDSLDEQAHRTEPAAQPCADHLLRYYDLEGETLLPPSQSMLALTPPFLHTGSLRGDRERKPCGRGVEVRPAAPRKPHARMHHQYTHATPSLHAHAPRHTHHHRTPRARTHIRTHARARAHTHTTSGSMEPGFTRGDILFLWMGTAQFRVGEVVVFKVCVCRGHSWRGGR